MMVNKHERREHLLSVCKHIAAGHTDADDVDAWRKAVLQFVTPFVAKYDIDTKQALKNLFQSESEVGVAVRKAFDVIDDQNVRSVATGAIYPRGDRWYLDVVGDPDDIDEADDDDDEVGKADHHASVVADLLVESGRFPHRRAALFHLLHKPAGQALLARMNKKDKPMTSTSTHAEFVRDVVKQYGIVALAKSMVKDAKSYGLDELAFTTLATEHAQRLYPNDRPDSAFSKLYEAEESVRRACNIAKAAGPAFDVTIVHPGEETRRTVNDTEQSEAYQTLQALTDKLHAAAMGKMTKEQAFARAFESRPDLAAKAHRRPTAPANGAYPFPR